MSKQLSDLEKLIQSYLAGKTSVDENRLLHRWMESLDLSSTDPTEEDLQQLKLRIDAVVKPEPQHTKRISWRWNISAAAVLLCISIASLLFFFDQKNTSLPTAAINQEQIIREEIDRLRVISNHSDRNKKFALCEGSMVILTPNSSIRFIDGFNEHSRHIYLYGKALFDVAKDTTRPFSVITGEIHTTALGTVFWVSHFEPKEVPTVSLLSGRVEITKRLADGGRELMTMLKPGEVWENGKLLTALARVNVQSKQQAGEASAAPALETLAFHHTPLTAVFATLSAHYQTKFAYSEDDITGMTFYGNYTKEIGLSDIIQHIALTNELKIQYNDTTATYMVSNQIVNQSND